MDWAQEFYGVTGEWWGSAESIIDDVDRLRAALLAQLAPESIDVLELGCGYGTTATATAETGRHVTGVDFSSRIDYGRQVAPQAGSLALLRDDFYTADLGRAFDAVCYWDGFGIGTDDDQIRLLQRIERDWLAIDGVAIIEVFNPQAWAADDGLEEILESDPVRGYHHRLGHRRSYDHATNITQDIWWEVGSDREWTQSLRCYSPADFASLAEIAGLRVDSIGSLDSASHRDPSSPPTTHSYIAALTLG